MAKNIIDILRELRRAGRDIVSGKTLVPIDYGNDPTPRYGFGKPPQKQVQKYIAQFNGRYTDTLKSFLPFKDQLAQIAERVPEGSGEPCWNNNFFSGLDAIALYSLVAKHKPKRYIEIGSGNSTKFARRAIDDFGLQTELISIDPFPRAEIDFLCDQIIREPLEKVDLSFVDQLGDGDILFYDGSHRTYMNSDVTVFFLEVLPRLRPGVLFQIHDIFLPYDYPPEWKDRYYSEQYMLACYLLAQGTQFEVLLPNYYVSQTPNIARTLDPLWEGLSAGQNYRSGVSFWLRRP